MSAAGSAISPPSRVAAARDPDADAGEDLIRLIHRTGRALHAHAILTGVALLIAIAAGALFAACVADVMLAFSTALRIAVFFALLLSTGAVGAWCVLRPLLRPPAPQDVALAIEAAHPAMHNRLITVLALHRAELEPQTATHQPFVQELLAQTRRRLAAFVPGSIVDRRRARAAWGAAALALCAIACLAWVMPDRFSTALARVLRPTADIAPITSIAFHAEPGVIAALKGDPVTIIAVIDRGEARELSIQFRSRDGNDWMSFPMRRDDDGRFRFTIDSLDDSRDYRITGGGTWSPVHRIEASIRPAIDRVAASVRLPDYLGISEPISMHAGLQPIPAPIGSTLELSVATQGPISEARTVLTRLEQSEETRSVERELVWIEDDLPADAQTVGDWRWREQPAAPVYSGAKSHTFGWSRKPYGFSSRLRPLALEPESSFFIYAHLDAAAPPTRLIVELSTGRASCLLVWATPDVDQTPLPPRPMTRVVDMGALAGGGRWVRLEAHVRDIVGAELPFAARFVGMTLAAEGGDINFDRCGTLQRGTETVATAKPRIVSSHPLSRGDDGRWAGSIPFRESGQLAIELKDAQGRANLPHAPIALTARPDQPPLVYARKPGQHVTLTESRPLPIVASAEDDFGLESVGIQVVRDPEQHEGDIRWLATLPPGTTQHEAVTALPLQFPDGRTMKPGDAIFYRVAAKDRREQVSFSDAWRVELAKDAAQREPDAKTQDPLASNADDLDAIAGAQKLIAADAARALEQLPSPLNEKEPRDEQGKPLSPQQIDELYKDWLATKTNEQREQVKASDEAWKTWRDRAAELAKQLEKQAKQAESAPLASPKEDDALRAMAEQLRETSAAPPQRAREQAQADRVQQQHAQAGEQQRELTQLAERFRDLLAAKAARNDDPAKAEKAMEDLLGKLRPAEQTASKNPTPGDAMPSEVDDVKPGTKLPASNGSAALSGEVKQANLAELPLSSDQARAIYLLPPRLREPLLSGMRQAAPRGYERFIDLYYRRLAEQVK